MRYIIRINDTERKYLFSVWRVHEYDDEACSEDSRMFESDNSDELVEFIASLVKGTEMTEKEIRRMIALYVVQGNKEKVEYYKSLLAKCDKQEVTIKTK